MNSHAKPRPHSQSSESDAHRVTRHFRTGVRILLSLSLIATVVFLFFFQKAAYLAAIPIPFLYAILALVNYLEYCTRQRQRQSTGESGISREEMELDAKTVGLVTLLKVLGILAIGTFIIAAAFFEWQMVAMAAAALFFLIILIQMPYLPLYFSESERDELDRLQNK